MGTNTTFKNILFSYKYYKMVQENDQELQAIINRCISDKSVTKKGIAEIVKNINPKDIHLEINSYPITQINLVSKAVSGIYFDRGCETLGLSYVEFPEYNAVMLYLLRQNKQNQKK